VKDRREPDFITELDGLSAGITNDGIKIAEILASFKFNLSLCPKCESWKPRDGLAEKPFRPLSRECISGCYGCVFSYLDVYRRKQRRSRIRNRKNVDRRRGV